MQVVRSSSLAQRASFLHDLMHAHLSLFLRQAMTRWGSGEESKTSPRTSRCQSSLEPGSSAGCEELVSYIVKNHSDYIAGVPSELPTYGARITQSGLIMSPRLVGQLKDMLPNNGEINSLDRGSVCIGTLDVREELLLNKCAV